MTENEAVQRCQRGDRDAFRYLVELHQGVVFGTAYNMTGNRALAEEMAQEAFLSAWKGDTRVRAREAVQALADAHPGQHGDGASPQEVGRDYSYRRVRMGRRSGVPRGFGRVQVGATDVAAGD